MEDLDWGSTGMYLSNSRLPAEDVATLSAAIKALNPTLALPDADIAPVRRADGSGTTFNWTGAGFITRAQGERDAWRELFDVDGWVNPSLTNVRQAFADIFSGGTAPAPANRTHLLAVARRKASRIEKLYATGTGSTGSPGTLVFEGTVTPSEIIAAYTLP